MSSHFKFLLVFFIVVISIILDFSNLEFYLKESFQNQIKKSGVILPELNYKIYNIFKPLSNFFSKSKEIEKLKSENQTLIKELSKVKIELQEINSLKLFKESEANTQTNFSSIPAKIISFDSMLLPAYFVIDKGEQQGVKEGLAVVDENHFLVGKIKVVYSNSAIVDLIYNYQQPIPVKFLNSNSLGLIETGDYNYFLVDLIDKNTTISIDELIVTAGSQYPPGLVLGKVKNIIYGEIFNQARAEFTTNFKNFNLLFVIQQ